MRAFFWFEFNRRVAEDAEKICFVAGAALAAKENYVISTKGRNLHRLGRSLTFVRDDIYL